MRHLFLLIPILLHTSIVFTQDLSCTDFGFNFENDLCIDQLIIDTVSNPGNLWQIGKPRKEILNSALSEPNVIVTDTINTYSINDTSSFTIRKLADFGFVHSYQAELYGNYYVNSDTLNDFGIIEFSPDNGRTWIDLINDTIYTLNYEWYPKPVLSGNSNGWVEFSVNLAGLGEVFDIQFGDTIIYRFSFISDNKPDSLDGLMYDNLHFSDYLESVESKGIEKLYSTVFPNPATNKLYLEVNNTESIPFQLKIFDNIGRRLYEEDGIDENIHEIDVSEFSQGIYYYKLINTFEKKGAWGSFVVR